MDQAARRTASRSSPAPRAASAAPRRSPCAEAGAHVIALARTQGALEELDDEIRAAGGTRHPRAGRTSRISTALDRLGAAIHERWGKLDILLGNAGDARRAHAARPCRPAGLGRGDGGQRHRQLAADPLARPAAARLRRRPRDLRHLRRRPQAARPIGAPYSVSKAALEALVRTYAAETATTPVQASMLVNPGPLRTRMRARRHAGRGPADAAHAGRPRAAHRAAGLAGVERDRQDLRLPAGQGADAARAGLSRTSGLTRRDRCAILLTSLTSLVILLHTRRGANQGSIWHSQSPSIVAREPVRRMTVRSSILPRRQITPTIASSFLEIEADVLRPGWRSL